GEEHRSWKAEPYQGKPAVPTGFDYLEVMVSELSIVGVGANPRALLEGAPEGMAKALRCIGGKCFSSWAPDEPVDPVYATVLKEFRGMKRMLERHRDPLLSPAEIQRLFGPRAKALGLATDGYYLQSTIEEALATRDLGRRVVKLNNVIQRVF